MNASSSEATGKKVSATLQQINELIALGRQVIEVQIGDLKVSMAYLTEDLNILRDQWVDASSEQAYASSNILATVCFAITHINDVPVEQLWNISPTYDDGTPKTTAELAKERAAAVAERFVGKLPIDLRKKLWTEGYEVLANRVSAALGVLLEGEDGPFFGSDAGSSGDTSLEDALNSSSPTPSDSPTSSENSSTAV